MIDIILALWSWLPIPLQILFVGAFTIMVIWLIVKLIIAIMDMIPFA